MVSIIGLALAAPAILLLSSTSILYVALGTLAFYGCCRNFSDANAMPVLCLYVDPRYRATSWGVSTLFSSFVGGMGIYAAGCVRDARIDPGRMFQFAFVSMVLCAGLLAVPARRPRLGRD